MAYSAPPIGGTGPPGDPGGGDHGRHSYADRLKTNVKWDQRLKRNILEITLEKTDKASDNWFELDLESIARLLKVLGIDIRNQVQGYLSMVYFVLNLTVQLEY